MFFTEFFFFFNNINFSIIFLNFVLICIIILKKNNVTIFSKILIISLLLLFFNLKFNDFNQFFFSIKLIESLFNNFSILHPIIIYFSQGCLMLFNNLYSLKNKKLAVHSWITLIFFGLILGVFWSSEELFWEGFWNWDPIELYNGMLLSQFLFFFHFTCLKKNHSLLNKSPFVLFIFFLLTKIGLPDSIHNFVISTSWVFNWIVVLILIKLAQLNQKITIFFFFLIFYKLYLFTYCTHFFFFIIMSGLWVLLKSINFFFLKKFKNYFYYLTYFFFHTFIAICLFLTYKYQFYTNICYRSSVVSKEGTWTLFYKILNLNSTFLNYFENLKELNNFFKKYENNFFNSSFQLNPCILKEILVNTYLLKIH